MRHSQRVKAGKEPVRLLCECSVEFWFSRLISLVLLGDHVQLDVAEQQSRLFALAQLDFAASGQLGPGFAAPEGVEESENSAGGGLEHEHDELELAADRSRSKTGRRNRCGKCGMPKRGHVCAAAETPAAYVQRVTNENVPRERKAPKRPKTNIKTHRLVFVEDMMREQGDAFDPICYASGLLMPSAQTGLLMCADMHICQEYCTRVPCEHC